MKEVAKDALSEMCAPVFEAHPEAVSFTWRQYTDYFNDGDTCTFSAYTDAYSIEVNGQDGYEISKTHNYEKVDGEHRRIPIPESELNPLRFAQSKFSDILNSIGDDSLKEMFGDHREVTVHRDGSVEVDEYEDHD